MTSRAASDEAYVLGLCDELLGQASQRQARFAWLLGDPSPRSGRQARLPVDGYWPNADLVVEYREKQHYEAIAHFDKPDRMTVSGVHRGEQRRRYDLRRETEIPAHGLRLVIVSSDDLSCDSRGRLRRDRAHDLGQLRVMFSQIRP